MIFAALFCLSLASIGQAHQKIIQLPESSPEISKKNAALINFSHSLKNLVALLGSQDQSPEVPLYRLQPSQVFSAFSSLTQQIGQCLPPGQQKILGLFSIATGLAADLLSKDEQAQKYKEFLRYQAAQEAQESQKTRSIEDSLYTPASSSLVFLSQQTQQLPQDDPAIGQLFVCNPSIACVFLSKTLKTFNVLDDAALQAMISALHEEDAADLRINSIKNALAEVSFSLHELGETITPQPQQIKTLLTTQTVDEYRRVIDARTKTNIETAKFATNLFSLINQATRNLIQESLNLFGTML